MAAPPNNQANLQQGGLTLPSADETEQLTIEPYHVFSRRQKWAIVYLVSMAGLFSPLSSNIYFPAIDTISHDLSVSPTLVALTISVYMIVQGIVPSLFGALSDIHGRRTIFILTFSVYIASNLGLAFTANFPMLLVLRGLQAAGSSANISISIGVISDIATPKERGGFIGTNSGIRMMGQAFGPVIGSALNSFWGYRSIFWFLFSLSVVVITLLVSFLPETHRRIAGNGSVQLKGIYRPLFYIVRPTEFARAEPQPSRLPSSPGHLWRTLTAPLANSLEKDIFVLLLWGALVYMVWSMVTSSTTTVMLKEFPDLTSMEIGLCFLPNGAGCMIGSILTGRLMDWKFRQLQSFQEESDKKVSYERARLWLVPYLSATMIVATALYGTSYELNDLHRYYSANLAPSLILQFFISLVATAIFCINSTMLVDCFPTGSAGATATNNLFRCLIGAAGVSAIQPMITAVRIRNAFLILAGIMIAASPLVWLESKYGEKWRVARESKDKERAEIQHNSTSIP